MSGRAWQVGDRVEWDANPGNRVLRGTIETVGGGRDEGIVMVLQDGYPKSRPVSRQRLRDARKVAAATPRGGEVA